MNSSEVSPARCIQFDVAIPIEAPPERVWQALTLETNAWWLAEFRMVSTDSTMTFDLSPGGQGLIETALDGSFLQWYAVQAYFPQSKKIYLAGYLAADYGGPSTNLLILSVVVTDHGSELQLVDSHHGSVDEKTIASIQEGWQQLFGDGLKRYVEG